MVKVLNLKEKVKLMGYLVRKRNLKNSAWEKNPKYANLMPSYTTKFCRSINQVEDLVRSGFFQNGEILIQEVYRGESHRIYPQKAERLNVVDCSKFSFPIRS